MSKGRILVIDDDPEISNLLNVYLSEQGYNVQVASRGEDALLMTRKSLPQLIILDVVLPGMDGFEVCRELRQTTRTSHIPIIFLTAKNGRDDIIQGLELGADDYITKPFDIEELRRRVKTAIERAERARADCERRMQTERIPGKNLVAEVLRDLKKTSDPWTYINLKINNFAPFEEVYEFIAATDVLRSAALLFGELVDELGTPDDFIGVMERNNFVIITYSNKPDQLEQRIIDRFNVDVLKHYSSVDRELGYIVLPNIEQRPLMTLSTQSTHQFPIEGWDIP